MIQFQNLRQGSQVFILHKGMTPYYEAGTVEQIPSMQMIGYYPNLPMMPLDITVRVGEQLIPYRQIPPTAESVKVTSQTTGEEVCLACSKEAVNTEVEIMIRQSVEAINSVEAHKQRVETCKNLLNTLNPEKVKEAQQAQRIEELEGQIAEMRKMFEAMSVKSGASS